MSSRSIFLRCELQAFKSTGDNAPVVEARGPLFAGAMRGRGIQSVILDTKVGCRFQDGSQIADLRSQS